MMSSPSRMACVLVLACLSCAITAAAQEPSPAAAVDPYSPEANSEAFPEPAAPQADPAPAQEPPADPAPAEEQPAPEATGEAPPPPAAPPVEEPFPGWNKLQQETGAAMGDEGADPLAEGGPASAPEPRSGWKTVASTFSALLIVLALIIGCYVALGRLRRHAPMLGGGELAQVIGRLHLDPRYALHFVRVGDRVLLLGVSQQSVALLETFDGAAFDPAEGATPTTESPQDFLAHLRASGEALNPMPASADDDEEIVSLRGDIERLKRYLEEGPRSDPENP